MEIYLPFIKSGVFGAQSDLNIRGELKGECFQVLGFDLLIDNQLKSWLLEINDNPSLYIYLEKDFMGGGVEKILSEVDL